MVTGGQVGYNFQARNFVAGIEPLRANDHETSESEEFSLGA